jgi:glycosyltransferase involved in cell wall biosynthesis
MPLQRIVVIFPAKDEQGRIGPVLDSVHRVLPGADRVVISDGSSDATAREAALAGARVLPHAVNLGYGASLETGYRHAVGQGYDGLLQMDGDGQHLAEELPRLLDPILRGEADMVIGTRHGAAGPGRAASPLRFAGQRFFSALLLMLTGRWFTDPTSGFQALGPRALRFFASGVFPCDYPDADVLLMAHLAGLRVVEVPVKMQPRVGGRSMHAGLKPLYYGIKMVLSLFVVLLNTATWRDWRRQFRAGG